MDYFPILQKPPVVGHGLAIACLIMGIDIGQVGDAVAVDIIVEPPEPVAKLIARRQPGPLYF